jgi:hypothetical protein
MQESKFPVRMRQFCFTNWLTVIDGILIPINGSQNYFCEIWDSVRSKIDILFDASRFFWAGLVENHNSNYIKYNIYL